MLSLVQIHNFWVLGGNFSSVSIANSLLCTDSRQFQLSVSSQSQLSPITPPPPPPLFTPYNWTLQVNDHWQYDTRIYRPSKSNINWTDSTGSWVQSEERQMFQLPIDVPLALTLCETSSARGSRRNQFKLFGVPNCPYLLLLLLCYRWPTNQKLFSMCLHSKQIKLKGINKMRGFFLLFTDRIRDLISFSKPTGPNVWNFSLILWFPFPILFAKSSWIFSLLEKDIYSCHFCLLWTSILPMNSFSLESENTWYLPKGRFAVRICSQKREQRLCKNMFQQF